MKILSFSATEILPALLSRKKVQTIRPAWHFDVIAGIETLITKPARLAVGDKVKHIWHQRSKYKEFCSGKTETAQCLCNEHYKRPNQDTCGFCGHTKKQHFNKLLGTAEITEVFKIEMCANHTQMGYYVLKIGDCDLFNPEVEDLAKADGFQSAEQMFSWFNKKYDLSQSKQFWVYRWKWS